MPVRRGSEGAELIFALAVTDIVGHIQGKVQVSCRRKKAETLVCRIGFVGHPGMERRPLGATRKAVLDSYVLEVLECPVKAGDFQLQLSVTGCRVSVYDGVRHCQRHRRRRRHEMGIERHVVVDHFRLVLRQEVNLYSFMVEDRLVGLRNRDGLLDGGTLFRPDSTAVDGCTVHQYLQTCGVRVLSDRYVIPEWESLMNPRHIGAVESGCSTLSGWDVRQGDGLGGCLVTLANLYKRLLHLF